MTSETTFHGHPRMSHPTLIGVAFEMHFSAELSVQDVYTELGRKLAAEFPRASRRMSAGKVEVTVEQRANEEPAYSVKPIGLADEEAHFRFYNPESGCSFFVGPKIIAMKEEVSYEGWAKFSSILKFAIEAHHETVKTQTYARLKLVYSNRMPWVEGGEHAILRDWIIPNQPEIPGSLGIVGSQQVLTIQFPDGSQEITVSMPSYEEEDINSENPIIQFDIDHYAEFVDPQTASIRNLEIWLEIAHERIYQTYISALAPEFLEARK